VSRPTFLAILSLPAAAIGYAVTGAMLTSVLPVRGGPADLLLIFVPLFVAGLCMIPFLIPFVDRLAKRDLVFTSSSTKDKRRLLVELTPAGHDMYARCIARAHGVTRKTLAPLNAAEQRKVLDLLKKMI
jgi:hypothetical protein